MKKITKLVSILLTLAMVLSMVPATVVGAVEVGTTAGTGAILQDRVLNIYPATNITTVFGYYSDGTGADESTFVDGNDGYCVTDGWFGRAGYSECTPANGLIALVMTLSEPIDLGGMEMISHGNDYSPTSFDVQAYVDGAWVTVYTQSSNAFTSNLTQMFDFGTSTTTCFPLDTALKAARSATSVFPYPTSPQSRRSMGVGRSMSFLMSSMQRSWSSVST